MTDAQTEARAIVSSALPPHEQAMLGGDAIVVLADLIAAALAAKDAELTVVKVSNNKWLAKWERAEAQLAEANRKIAERDKALANYDRWLNGRDAYIVQKGLWQNFVASLPGSPTARRALEGGQEE